MKTVHRIVLSDARELAEVSDQSVNLIVTSPPYPMIEMWDALFSRIDPEIAQALAESDTKAAFEGMHRHLDIVWKEVSRTLAPGGILCVNIGDAVRTFKGNFQMFANHSRIITCLTSLGLIQLPGILWRKPTNAPNKFMGSGMLPAGAYVTLEHEHILIFRKSEKRDFSGEDARQKRRENAYFWEERNLWFSDVWFDLIGASQTLGYKGSRERSGAFPLELPYRLIHMFSLRGDLVLDPFAGTGTTLIAAMCTGRNSIHYEIDPSLHAAILSRVASVPEFSHALACQRFDAHVAFIKDRIKTKGPLKYTNCVYSIPVVTRQEEDLQINHVLNMHYLAKDRFGVTHDLWRPQDPVPNLQVRMPDDSDSIPPPGGKSRQLKLF